MDLRAQLEQRLAALRDELGAGRQLGAELPAREAKVQATVLRIAGAIPGAREELPATSDG